MKTIILASDHAGFALKESVKTFLHKEYKDKYTVTDVGAHSFVDGDDYPLYMADAGLRVAQDQSSNTKAIIFGKSGQGEAMVANRYPGVRAIVYYGSNDKDKSKEILKLSREHNDANVLSIGAGFVNDVEAIEAVKIWFGTEFSGEERHLRRIEEIDNIE